MRSKSTYDFDVDLLELVTAGAFYRELVRNEHIVTHRCKLAKQYQRDWSATALEDCVFRRKSASNIACPLVREWAKLSKAAVSLQVETRLETLPWCVVAAYERRLRLSSKSLPLQPRPALNKSS